MEWRWGFKVDYPQVHKPALLDVASSVLSELTTFT